MRTILIIDDEPEIVKILGIFLTKKGFHAIECMGGEEGLRRIKSKIPVDLIILDNKMPGINGPMILKEMAKMKNAVPVIMLTGSLEWIRKHKLIRQPAAVLMKPVKLELLLEKVNELLGESGH